MCCGPGCQGGAVVGQRRLAVAPTLPARAAQACTLAARTAMTSQVSGLPAIVGGFAGCWRDDEFVGRIHHDGGAALDAYRALEAHPGPAHQADDVRASVEQGGEVPGGV